MTLIANPQSGTPILRQIPGVIRAFYAIDLTLGLAYLADVASGCQLETLNNFLNLEREANLPTWYSSLQLFIVAALLGIFAYRNFQPSRLMSWALPLFPLLLLALSMDESTEIHEWMGYKSDSLLPGGDRRYTPFAYTGIWMFLIGIPFSIGFVALLVALRTYLRPTPGVLTKFLIGGLLLVGGATGVETLTNFIPLKTWLFYSEVFFEEVLEMAGVTTLMWGAYDLLKAHGFVVNMAPAQASGLSRMASTVEPEGRVPVGIDPAQAGIGPDHG